MGTCLRSAEQNAVTINIMNNLITVYCMIKKIKQLEINVDDIAYLRMFAGYNFDFSTSGFYLVE